jgi:hypothetical protein
MKHFSASFSIHLTLAQFVVAVLVLWMIVGDSVTRIAGLLYRTGPAPWEELDLVYYPDRRVPSVSESMPDLGSLGECRTRARQMAAQHDDRDMERGVYECRTASVRPFSSRRVHRLSLK